MTEQDPLRVDVIHRGRRRRVPLVFTVYTSESGDGRGRYVTVEGYGSAMTVFVYTRLPGCHDLTDRFLEEMAEDLGPDDGDPSVDGGAS